MLLLTRKLLSILLGSLLWTNAVALDDPLVGQVLIIADEVGNSLPVRVDAVALDPQDSAGDIYLYTVSVQNPADNRWQPLCEADRTGSRQAIPLAGHWDEQGRHHASGRITFACTIGVLAKCVRWGYKPWLETDELPMQALHQACTRMARADYCGTGKPHTREGTPINVFDRFAVQRREPIPQMLFEAAWGAEGAIAVARGRYSDVTAVLAECPDKLTYHPSTEPTDLSVLQQKYPDALLFNESYSAR